MHEHVHINQMHHGDEFCAGETEQLQLGAVLLQYRVQAVHPVPLPAARHCSPTS